MDECYAVFRESELDLNQCLDLSFRPENRPTPTPNPAEPRPNSPTPALPLPTHIR